MILVIHRVGQPGKRQTHSIPMTHHPVFLFAAINVLSIYSIVSLAVADGLIALFKSCKKESKPDAKTVSESESAEPASPGAAPPGASKSCCSGLVITRLCRFATAIVRVCGGVVIVLVGRASVC